MNDILRFLRSRTGNVSLLVIIAAIAGGIIYQNSEDAKHQRQHINQVETLRPEEMKETILRDGRPFKVPAPPPLSVAEGKASVKTDLTPNVKGVDTQVPSPAPRIKPSILPISLFAGDSAPGVSKKSAPYGRLISCETVVTLESSKLDTPLIGLVTEDVWNDGELVIPAGAEIHGRASVDHSRERIAASGKWIVVWRDAGPLNGTELVLSGIALDREKDEEKGEFGLLDGSAGLRGDLVKSDNLQEIKLFASTFLAGLGSGVQQMQNQTTALGSVLQVPLRSSGNAALQGASDVLNTYARQIQDAITRDGFFVRVPSGKQFYLYVTETIDQSKGTVGNIRNEELWKKEHESSTNPPSTSPARRL